MEDDLKTYLLKIKSKFTEEYFDKLAEDNYKEDREYLENFSNWFYNIENLGNFKIANIISNQIFTLEETKYMRKEDIISKVNWKEWNKILKPTLDKMKDGVLYNIRNGCFSNKFDFSTCITDKEHLAENLFKINYMSSLYDTGGYTELVVREIIRLDDKYYLKIYNGMPLTEEVRIFYNMDKQRIEYMNDYWDYEYCKNKFKSLTDIILFETFHNKSNLKIENHGKLLSKVMKFIEENIDNLKFKNLKGIWSIDFLYDRQNNDIYLIDMARGYKSAYFDESRLLNDK